MPQHRAKILIIDDEVGIRELLSDVLTDEGYFVVTAHDAVSGWKRRTEEKPDLVLLDIWMPDMDGVCLLRQWAESGLAKVPVVVMSGHATIESAVEATRLGAVEVMEKPIATKHLLSVVDRALAKQEEVDVNPRLQQANFGETGAMRDFKQALLSASAVKSTVLMVGEFDSGADFFAQFLATPKMSVRFIEKGAQLEGDIDTLLRQGENGLLIVRPIGLSNITWQAGLLGIIRESARHQTRVVICDRVSPSVMAEKWQINDALLSLLSQRIIYVPSLKNYKPDIPAIAELIIQQVVTDTDKAAITLSDAAKKALLQLRYDGNFSELLSIIRSAILYVRGDIIDSATIKMMAEKWETVGAEESERVDDDIYTLPFRQARDLFEQRYFIRLVDTMDGNIPEAAKRAELERTYFYRKIKRYRKGDI